jgi:hypothetical protein
MDSLLRYSVSVFWLNWKRIVVLLFYLPPKRSQGVAVSIRVRGLFVYLSVLGVAHPLKVGPGAA